MTLFHTDKSWPKVELSNPRLLAAMQRDIDERTPDAEATVFKELLRARFLVPLADEDDQGEEEKGEEDQDRQLEGDDHAEADGVAEDDDSANGRRLPVITFVDEDRQTVLIAFTDGDACRNWSEEDLPYAVIDNGAIFNLAQSEGAAGLVLNPDGPMRTELTRDEIDALAGGNLPEY